MWRISALLALLIASPLFAADEPTVFKSDVAMTRVDAQVLDSDGRPVTGLRMQDFVLRLNGHVLPIRNLASENMPLDVLLLLDVSGSMEPHVQRIASASQQALNVLADKDRVAIMVFDTYTRVRLPFRSNHSDVTNELHRLLRSESFNGGTRITRAMLDAASYVQREGRQDARRAIVVLTDDETQDEEDEPRVESALAKANAVMSFLRAPYDPPTAGGRPGGQRRGTWGSGGTWPGSGGGIGFPGSGGPLGRGGPGGAGGGYDPSHTAGTAEIARDSGGDVMQVDEASALEDTLERLRQRYALYFYLPEGSKAGDGGSVQVGLSDQARIRYHDAELHYRRVYMSGANSNEHSGPTAVTRVDESVDTDQKLPPARSAETPVYRGRRAAVDEGSGSPVNTIDNGPDTSDPSSPGQGSGTAPPAAPPAPQTPAAASAPSQPAPAKGWPRANPPGNPPGNPPQ